MASDRFHGKAKCSLGTRPPPILSFLAKHDMLLKRSRS